MAETRIQAAAEPRTSQVQRSQMLALVTSPPRRLIRDGPGELTATDATGPAVWTLGALTAAARAAGIPGATCSAARGRNTLNVRWSSLRPLFFRIIGYVGTRGRRVKIPAIFLIKS